MGEVSAPWRLQLLGTPRLVGPDGRDRTPAGRQAIAALACIALEPAGIVRRERLAGLLWTDRGDKQAQDSLRQVIMALRSVLGDAMRSSRDSIAVDLTVVEVDVLVVERVLATDATDATTLDAAHAVRGALLDGLSLPAAGFEEWLEVERSNCCHRLLRALATALRAAERRGGGEVVEALAAAMLRLDPVAEDGHRARLEAAVARADWRAAARRWEECEAAFRRHLDMRPPPLLEALAARARGVARNPAPRPAQTRRHIPTIALVARPPIGPAELVRPLADVVEEELTDALARCHAVRLLRSVPVEAADYGLVAWVRADGRIARVTLQLRDGATGAVLLVERRDIDVEAAFRSLEGVCEALAGIGAEVEQAVLVERRANHREEPEDAYALWLEGDRQTDSFSAEGLAEAGRRFRQATEIDPLFAPPVAGLASIALTEPMIRPSVAISREAFAPALIQARRAVELDPFDARSRIILAWAYMRSREPARGREQFQRALGLNPGDPSVLIAAAEGLAHLGEAGIALGYGERALRLHPAPPAYHHFYLLQISVLAGLYERALEHAAQAPSSPPEHLAWRIVALARLGQAGEAQTAARALVTEIEARWNGAPGFSHDALLRWLDSVILTADPTRRCELVETVSQVIGIPRSTRGDLSICNP